MMSEILTLIQERHSARRPFDRHRPVAQQDLRQILEAARWAPTAHNMQNFEIIVVDDAETITRIGDITSPISEVFIRENYQQLSFSEDELRLKKVGLLATMFPSSWRVPDAKLDLAALNSERALGHQTARDTPLLLIVAYDIRKRAPASEGDVLGVMSLGCVLDNMWLIAQSLKIGFHVLSALSTAPTENEVKRILGIPDYLKIAFPCRIGYPLSAPDRYLRVRREVEDFTHYNQYGNKGLG